MNENIPVQAERPREIPTQISRIGSEIENIKSALDRHFSSIRAIMMPDGDTSMGATSLSVAPDQDPMRTELGQELAALADGLKRIRVTLESETHRIQL